MRTMPLLLIPLALLGCDPDDKVGEDSLSGVDSSLPDEDGDGFVGEEDCDDSDPEVNAGAEELCDGVDQDCDGEIDEDATDSLTFYADADGDGYGDEEDAVTACEAPSGYVEAGGDCDDGDSAYNPGATEDDCADPNDYNCDGSVGYADEDGDGYAACEECDDGAAEVNPAATELCNGVDDDCDEDVDEDDAADAATWYQDVDGDGYGDGDFSTAACEEPEGYADNGEDCDDGVAEVNPAASEVCNGLDDDCDGLTDDEDDSLDSSTGETFYTDGDGDGFGDANDATMACEAPSGTVSDSSDCDDATEAVNPDATEVCNEVDDDCDGLTDDEDDSLDTSTAETWYGDADGDGYGDADDSELACEQPSDAVADSSDCDDSDASISPGAAESWYDGVDSDCDGSSDYDADGDGDDALDYGGTDCDDSDASRYGGVDCRPEVSCTHPSASTIAAYDPAGSADLVFTDACEAVIPTVISGQDYIYIINNSGVDTILYGTSNYNINSAAIDPATGAILAGYSSTQGVGYESGTGFTTLALSGTGAVTSGIGPFSNHYMKHSPPALVMDTAGSIWTPNWATVGVLAEVETDGTVSTFTLDSSEMITAVDLDSSEALYASIDDTIYQVNKSSGSLSAVYVASDTILDFVFDYNDDLYVESADDVITWVSGDLSSESTFASVSGDAKLAISPDGWLVRVLGDPVGYATWEEFELGD